MKSTYIVFFALIALSSAFKAFRAEKGHHETLGDAAPAINGTLQDLSDYLMAVGNYFNVDFTSALKCYNLVTAEAYFKLIDIQTQIEQAMLSGDRAKATLLGKAAGALQLTLANATNCSQSTQAFADFQ